MSLPLNTPTEFEVKRVEVKKTDKTRDGKRYTIFKLGLQHGEEKGWAEFFAIDGTLPPGEDTKETLILSPGKFDGLEAKRPRKTFGGRSPADTKAIQRQHSQEMALRYVALLPSNAAVRNPAQLPDTIKHWTDWFEEDIAS